MSNDENDKSQWDIDRERQIARDTKRGYLFRAIGAVVLCAFIFGGYNYYQYISDPLISGIPPKENADGTIDYTLIGYELNSGEANAKQVLAWIVRLPNKYQAHLAQSHEIDLLGTNGTSVVTAVRNNETLAFTVSPENFDPYITKEPFSQISSAAATIFIEADGRTTDLAAHQELLAKNCSSMGTQVGPLVQYTNSAGNRDNCGIGNAKTASLYALLKQDKILASLACLNDDNSCYYVGSFKNRRLSGLIGRNHLGDFDKFYDGLQRFLVDHTISDRAVDVNSLRRG
jgi:hypothetical protein